jgi:hypothetical protein
MHGESPLILYQLGLALTAKFVNSGRGYHSHLTCCNFLIYLLHVPRIPSFLGFAPRITLIAQDFEVKTSPTMVPDAF